MKSRLVTIGAPALIALAIAASPAVACGPPAGVGNGAKGAAVEKGPAGVQMSSTQTVSGVPFVRCGRRPGRPGGQVASTGSVQVAGYMSRIRRAINNYRRRNYKVRSAAPAAVRG